MRGASRQPLSAMWIVVLVVTATALSIDVCAAQSAQGKLVYVPTMTAPVLVLFNEGAAAIQEGDLPKAQEKYQAALEQARTLEDEQGIGFSLNGLAAVHNRLQDYPKALEFYSAALPYFIAGNNLSAQMITLGAMGYVQVTMGNNASTIQAFDRALGIMEKLLANASEQEKLALLPLRAKALIAKALAHEKLEQWTEAVDSYRRAASDFAVIGNPERAGRALWSAGTVTRSKMKNPRQAVELLSEAWPLLQDAGKVENSIWARTELGLSYQEAGKFKEAAATYTEVIKAADREGFPKLAIHGYSGLGRALDWSGEFREALTAYDNALQWLRESDQKPDPLREADFLYLKGGIYRLLSQYEEAIEHFRVAAVKSREAQAVRGEAEALTQLAEILFWIADYKTAAQYYKQVLQLYKTAGDLPKQIETLAAVGEASWLSGGTSWDEAWGYFEEGNKLMDLIIAEVGFNPFGPMVEALKITEKKFKRDEDQLAREWKQRIPSLRKWELFVLVPVDFAMRHSEATFQEWHKKVPSLGSDYLLARGTFFQKIGAITVWGGNPQFAIGQLRTAEDYLLSVPYNRELGIIWAKNWFYLAEAHRQKGDFNAALYYFNKARMTALLLGSPEVHWLDAGLAQTYADMGDTDRAKFYYEKALKTLESIQTQQGTEEIKIGVFEGALHYYRAFVTLLLDRYEKTGDTRYLHESFEINERLRARAFLDMLGRSRVTRLGGESGALVEKEDEFRHQIARIHRQLRVPHLDKAAETQLLDRLENLRESWRTLQKQAAQQSDRYAQVVFPRPVTVEEVQSVLDPESVLLEYFLHTKTSTLWAITKDHVQAYTLPGSEKLAVLMQYFKTLREPLMGVDEVSQHLALGRELYTALVRPAKQQIRGKKHLIIAPDGPLYYLPFEALIMPDSEDKDEESEHETLANARYLVKEFRVTYVPSASVFVTQRKKLDTQVATVRFPLVAFGDPVYEKEDSTVGSGMQTKQIAHQILRGPSLSRLEFSATEVRRIAHIWGVPLDSAHINLRDRATVERVRELDLSRYRMLHFATHGVLGDEIGLTTQPALVFSQIGDEDGHGGLLQFADILDLKLNADLVVLSACSTGLGRLRQGEGIVGLTRAFLYAGASSVVVSLWKVEDQSTSLLMERFYQRLKQGESKSEALQQAKLDVLHTTIELKAIGMHQSLASPFYWAPFILVGEAR